MYKNHSSYNVPLNKDDFNDIVEKIEEEKNSVNADKHKLKKLEEAKLMRHLFNNTNCFNNTNRHFLPW